MEALIPSILAMIESVLPMISSAANVAIIDNIINVLAGAIPFIVTEAKALVPAIKNIIAALSANPATTAAQLVTLQALDAQADAAFDAAVTDTDADVAAAAAAANTPSS